MLNTLIGSLKREAEVHPVYQSGDDQARHLRGLRVYERTQTKKCVDCMLMSHCANPCDILLQYHIILSRTISQNQNTISYQALLHSVLLNIRWSLLWSSEKNRRHNSFVFFGFPTSFLKTQMCVSENRGVSPQIIHFNKDFHYKSSILGFFPSIYLENTQKYGNRQVPKSKKGKRPYVPRGSGGGQIRSSLDLREFSGLKWKFP